MANTNVKKIYMKELALEDLKSHEFLFKNEEVLMAFKGIRDIFVATNKKLVFIDKQGITGKKTEYLIIPLNKINCFSVETSGIFDVDSEFKVWVNGLGLKEFQLQPTLKESYKGQAELVNNRILQLAELLNNAITD